MVVILKVSADAEHEKSSNLLTTNLLSQLTDIFNQFKDMKVSEIPTVLLQVFKKQLLNPVALSKSENERK